MKNLVLLFTLFTLASCGNIMVKAANTSADMVSPPLTSKYGPKNAAGEVRYGMTAWAEINDARRESAYKLMHDSCNGKYEISQELRRGVWNHIQFKCI